MRRIPHLLTDEERAQFVRRLHQLRVRRLAVAIVLITVGSLMPEFHPHLVAVFVADSAKGLGYIPLLKLFEDILV